MYAQDYDERLTGRVMWTKKIQPYVKNWQLYGCPAWGDAVIVTGATGYCQRVYGQFPNEQPIRGAYRVHCSATGSTTGRLLGDLQYPATTTWMADADNSRSVTYAGHCTDHSNPLASCANGPQASLRHNDGSNASFLDGHSKWAKVPADKKVFLVQPWRDWLRLDR